MQSFGTRVRVSAPPPNQWLSLLCVVTKLSRIVYTPLELVLAVIERAINSDYKEWF